MRLKKIINITFCTGSIALSGVLTSSIQAQGTSHVAVNRASSVDYFADLIRSQLTEVDAEEFKSRVIKQYQYLHMLDKNGNWTRQVFADHEDTLLPGSLSLEDQNSLIDEIAANLKKNPYLVTFLNDARFQTFTGVKQKFDTEGRDVIPNAVAYAFALEKVMTVLLENPETLGFFKDFWQEERKKAGVSIKQAGVFGLIKLHSVEQPIEKMVEFFETRNLDPQFLREFLTLNIYEAHIADKVKGNFDNSAAAEPLMKYKAGDQTENPETGAGAATFSDDGKKIEIRYAYAKEWNDLYQVWNLAFVTLINNYPYLFAKLLISQVSDYDQRPNEYIYRRALALYISLNYYNLKHIIDTNEGTPRIDWTDKELTRAWGAINKRSSFKYLELHK